MSVLLSSRPAGVFAEFNGDSEHPIKSESKPESNHRAAFGADSAPSATSVQFPKLALRERNSSLCEPLTSPYIHKMLALRSGARAARPAWCSRAQWHSMYEPKAEGNMTVKANSIPDEPSPRLRDDNERLPSTTPKDSTMSREPLHSPSRRAPPKRCSTPRA